jgi:hypothetical protein
MTWKRDCLLSRLTIALALAVAASPASAEVKVSVSYSEAADLYSLMDNVSGWLDGFVYPVYREEWVRRFGWSADDQKWADRYREYRQRSFIDNSGDVDPLASPDGIFASRTENESGSDPLATYFLAQPDIKTALANLGSFATPADARMLRGFYRHFAPKWRVVVSESGPLVAKAKRLEAKLDGAATIEFIGHVARFYGAGFNGDFKVFFTRYPPGKRSSAEPVAGRYILLHSPTAADDATSDWDTIVMHEFVHYVSARQPEGQKRRLTKRFLERCPLPAGAKRLWLLEEPLAVAWGQAAYSKFVLGHALNPNENWYAIPWVNTVSRTIAPTILEAYSTGSVIDEKLVDQAADRCKDLKAISNQLTSARPK